MKYGGWAARSPSFDGTSDPMPADEAEGAGGEGPEGSAGGRHGSCPGSGSRRPGIEGRGPEGIAAAPELPAA